MDFIFERLGLQDLEVLAEAEKISLKIRGQKSSLKVNL